MDKFTLEKQVRTKILELEELLKDAEKSGLSIFIKYQTHSTDFEIENERKIYTSIQRQNLLTFTTYIKNMAHGKQ